MNKINKQNDDIEKIKKLLVAQLIIKGISTDVIGDILDIDGSTVRRMIPASKLKHGEE